MADYQEYYEKSISVLTNYIKEKKEIPTEKIWNKIAGAQGYLTGQSLGYISQMKFPDLCKSIYKEIQRQGKEEKK